MSIGSDDSSPTVFAWSYWLCDDHGLMLLFLLFMHSHTSIHLSSILVLQGHFPQARSELLSRALRLGLNVYATLEGIADASVGTRYEGHKVITDR